MRIVYLVYENRFKYYWNYHNISILFLDEHWLFTEIHRYENKKLFLI